MSNIHNFSDYENNSTNSGRSNPWNQKQQPGYAQLDQSGNQQGGGILNGIDLTWKCFSAINLILVWVIFLPMQAISKLTDNQYNCLIFQAGAQYQPSITYNYEFHRYIVPVYLHGSFAHIISNSVGLFFYAFTLEKYYGIKKFVFFYLLCGFGGNLVSGFNAPEQMSVGASSSLFGLFPLIILFLYENPNMHKNQKVFYIIYILLMVLGNFFGGKSPNQLDQQKQGDVPERVIDQAAHVGGLLTGLCLSVLYSERKDKEFKRIKIASLVVLIGGLLFLIIYNQRNFDIRKPDGLEHMCAWK